MIDFYPNLHMNLPYLQRNPCIRLSGKFFSFYMEIIDAQHFLFYIILSNYARAILFSRDKHRDISQTWFHVCTKVHCCKKHVRERKTLSGQPNTIKTSMNFTVSSIHSNLFSLPRYNFHDQSMKSIFNDI